MMPRAEHLDLDERIENHGSTSIEIDLVFLHCRLLGRLVWILRDQKILACFGIPIGKLKMFSI